MNELKGFFKANEKMWDENAKQNYKSKMYRVEEFLEGKTTLNSIELEELEGGAIKGKTFLHLQCHFGLDTLSWAREGAKVTGVDFSEEAIRLARQLAEKTNLQGNFIQANIYDLPEILHEKFDIVFTSYGVLCWLNDLNRWAEIIAHFLKPGGVFYIVEFHPFIWVFDWDAKDDFRIDKTYFSPSKPYKYTADGSYAAEPNEKYEPTPIYEWGHKMSEVINAIIKAGLDIQFLHEFPFSPFPRFAFLKQSEDGYWRYDNPDIQLPLIYSIKAVKPE
ncbi:MAG: methyltransferase domain-containing protein [Candidatus Heimdallarchaeota archaeon]|nr:methyltransferase domain-containing protein [Candidatus Heimdallarchaeota archaeon]